METVTFTNCKTTSQTNSIISVRHSIEQHSNIESSACFKEKCPNILNNRKCFSKPFCRQVPPVWRQIVKRATLSLRVRLEGATPLHGFETQVCLHERRVPGDKNGFLRQISRRKRRRGDKRSRVPNIPPAIQCVQVRDGNNSSKLAIHRTKKEKLGRRAA